MKRRGLIDGPAWAFRLSFYWHRFAYMGWCMFVGHKPPVWKHHGAPVIGPLLICPRCGAFVRAE